jgi:hypothetical protein
MERMIAILCEHYAGKWPLWLNPRQVRFRREPVFPTGASTYIQGGKGRGRGLENMIMGTEGDERKGWVGIQVHCISGPCHPPQVAGNIG